MEKEINETVEETEIKETEKVEETVAVEENKPSETVEETENVDVEDATDEESAVQDTETIEETAEEKSEEQQNDEPEEPNDSTEESADEGKAEIKDSEAQEVSETANEKSADKKQPIPGIKLVITDVIMLILLVGFLHLRNQNRLVDVYYNVARPYHEFMMKLCSNVYFSVAELIYIVCVIAITVYIIWSIVHLIKDKDKWLRVYYTLMTLMTIVLVVVAAYEYMWTPYYSAPSFSEQSGISDESIYTEDLKTVTVYFANLANEYSYKVDRDANGSCDINKYSVISRSAKNYDSAAAVWPFLKGQDVEPKAIACSKAMSLLDFTGFFFPPTGETNVNVDSPAFMLPFTCEHEISHQRGIGPEQECNFIATVACLNSGDDEFIYSGALTAYIYLQNALKKVDADSFSEVRAMLNENVMHDLKENSDYWNSYSTTISEISNSAYENFLEGNGQELGLASYGACVNLLVHYYIEKIS